jgi:PKD domain
MVSLLNLWKAQTDSTFSILPSMKSLFHILLGMGILLSIGQQSRAQSSITGTVKGLRYPDSAVVRVQRDLYDYRFVKLRGDSLGSDRSFQFNSLGNGSWALSIDAPGYRYPPAKTISLNNSTSSQTITLQKSSGGNFIYEWQDDSSYVGHAQQSYINTPVTINVLGKAEPVPADFNAINLLNEYGFLLSNDSSTWTSEDAYRLYVTLGKLNLPKYGENQTVIVRAKWHITDKAVDRDIDYNTQSGVDMVTISRAAFTYASPLVVTLDGVKGRFFSKRLFHAGLYYRSRRGTESHVIGEIASARYGLRFMEPSSELQTLMSETSSNFQAFTSEEKLIIMSMMEEYPEAMQRQDRLKYLVRRINGQPNPVYPQAPAIAWTGLETIEFMEGAFSNQSIEYMQRLVLHEKAHFLWEYSFDSTTRRDWANVGGWFPDPTQMSGWSTTNTTEFVSAYAHLKNPNEDMAESIAFYITNPDALRSRSMRKFEFIRDRIMQGTRYVSIINPNMTFQVYNLYPDYNYPGKIKRSKIEVTGAPNEDKTITLEIELNTMNNAFNGAEFAATTLFSSVGTFKGMQLNKVNAEGSILRGQITLSKRAKSGYWTIPQIAIYDANRNARLEKSSTFGIMCFIDNPMEDVTAPLYIQQTLKLDSVSARIIDFSGRTADQMCGTCADTIAPMPAMRVKFDIEEKNTINPDGRAYATIFLPSLDSVGPNNVQPYSYDVQITGTGIRNDVPDSLKKAEFHFPVPYYYPRGYYSIAALQMTDIALNTRLVLLDRDTGNKSYFIPPNNINQRGLRDSLYFHTPYPDMKPPVIDLNDIQIKATPTRPDAPNGETLFEMWLWIRDTSDFAGKASGFNYLTYTLRDPQGLERGIQYQPDTYYDVRPDSSAFGFKRYRFSTLLPQGSPPGLWGVSSITLWDKARNRRYYNFTEIVRFDVETSKVLRATPFVSIGAPFVNAANADSIAVKIGCENCKDQRYRLRIYGSNGGTVNLFEGMMTSDTITLKNLDLTGIHDGNLFASVFILDSARALIGTGRASYLKDTEIPRVVVERATTSSLTETITLNASESVINQPSVSGLKISNGTITDFSRLSDTSFRVTIQRSCTDTLSLDILPGFFEDTVRNPSTQLSYLLVDTIVPVRPIINAPASKTLCPGDSLILNIQAIASGKLAWKRDGTTLSGQTGSGIIVRSAGTYTAEVTASNGCKSASLPVVVTAHPSPKADFTIASETQCLIGNDFRFVSTSTIPNGTLSLIWNFGDGRTSTLPTISNSYSSSGIYMVRLTAMSQAGCRDSISKEVRVLAMPAASLQAAPFRNIYPGLSTSITAMPGSAGNYTYQWYRNDVALIGETAQSIDSIGMKHASGRYRMMIGYASPLVTCPVLTPELVIGDSAVAKLFLFPNPNAGKFRMAIYQSAQSRLMVSVLDARGMLVLERNLDAMAGYGTMDIDLGNPGPGIYLVVVRDAAGKPLVTERFMIRP